MKAGAPHYDRHASARSVPHGEGIKAGTFGRHPARTTGRSPMAKTVVEQFVEILAAAGVKRIYGIVGDSLNGLTDSLRRQGKIGWIHVRRQEVGAFAAGAG